MADSSSVAIRHPYGRSFRSSTVTSFSTLSTFGTYTIGVSKFRDGLRRERRILHFLISVVFWVLDWILVHIHRYYCRIINARIPYWMTPKSTLPEGLSIIAHGCNVVKKSLIDQHR